MDVKYELLQEGARHWWLSKRGVVRHCKTVLEVGNVRTDALGDLVWECTKGDDIVIGVRAESL